MINLYQHLINRMPASIKPKPNKSHHSSVERRIARIKRSPAPAIKSPRLLQGRRIKNRLSVFCRDICIATLYSNGGFVFPVYLFFPLVQQLCLLIQPNIAFMPRFLYQSVPKRRENGASGFLDVRAVCKPALADKRLKFPE